MNNLSSQQFRRAADLKEQIESLEAELTSLLGGTAEGTWSRTPRMSAAGRARIAAAQRARWSKLRPAANEIAPRKRGRRMSAAAKARLAAIARARWKRAKAAGKNAL